MSLYSLNADYDRNGVLNASRSEYSARTVKPGAIVVPNVDADGVRLPTSVRCGSAPTPDISMNPKSGNDNDLIGIAVIANPGTDTSQHKVELKFSDRDAQRLRIYDSARHLMTGNSNAGYVRFPLTFKTNRVDLLLEALTFNESPKGPSLSSTGSQTQGQINTEITMHLDVFDLTGKLLEHDTGIVSISPLILLGDTYATEKLYMCDISRSPTCLSDNTPSFIEVQNAIGGIRSVQFVTIPLSISRGDSWVQDQFQVGYCQGAGLLMKVIFHLPRLRSDIVLTSSVDSLICMATDYFPSTNMGTFNDFWIRSIPIKDVDQGTQNVSFTNTVELVILFNKVFDVHDYMWRIVMEVDPSKIPTLDPSTDLVSIINNLNELKNQVLKVLDHAIDTETDKVKRIRLRNTKTDILMRVPALLREIYFRNDGALIAKTQHLTLALETKNIEDIIASLLQLHSSHNYGGNIEVTPPSVMAPLGRIVIGNSSDETGKTVMDPSLLAFLRMQQVQPLLEIDTSWLHVGHVDEIISFGTPSDPSKFPIIMAAPRKALQILEQVFLLNTQDLSEYDVGKDLYGRPLSLGDSNMARGAHPVTALLRGKQWLQVFRPDEPPIVFPPKIYRKMNLYYGDIGMSTRLFYPVPWADDHFYDARISVREMLYFGRVANNLVQEKMDEIKKLVSKELEEMPIIELPVLFDDYNPDFEKTIAFTPDLINFQIVNNYILIPRPYGPRMSIEDTIEVLKKVLDKKYYKYLNKQYFNRKGLNKTWHWAIDTFDALSHVITGPYKHTVTVNLDWLATQFKDGFFPETDIDKIKKKIRTARANAGKFLPGGNLRPGWHKIKIPENKVDVFEAYTQIMLEGTGLVVKWVDSWYYHVRSGGIHCGTNAIRTPITNSRTAWWNVKIGSSS
jgi:hypothetical protein